MVFLYQIGISLYILAVRMASLFSDKAKMMLEGRKSLFEALGNHFRETDQKTAWFHCASLGEFEQGRPVMEAFRQRFPDYQILLTFFSPSGYELRKNYEGADFICYLPFDTKTNAARIVNIVKPEVVFLVKYEFWYFLLQALHQEGSLLFSISTIFRSSQPFFKWYGGLHREILGFVDHFFVQNKHSAVLLQTINKHNFTISGDTRFDRVWQLTQSNQANSLVRTFCQDKTLMVAGSTWPQDIEVLAPLINQQKAMKFIIAPHEISEKNLLQTEKHIQRKYLRLSKATDTALQSADVLIIDNIGMLSMLYRFGKIAWIGGAYGAGLHNTLEAAAYGLPVFFGNKNYRKFDEALQLISLGGAQPIGAGKELLIGVEQLLKDEAAYQKKKMAILNYVQSQLGASQQIMEYSEQMLAKHEGKGI